MTEETSEDVAVCVCPQCYIPLFSDKWGIKGDQKMKCGVCSWEGVADDAKSIKINDWRDYLFDAAKETDIPPLPRNIFFMTAAERISGLVPDLGMFLAKWGVLSTDDLQQPWISEVFKMAGWAFFRTVAHGVKNPPKPKEPEQQELPLVEPIRSE